MECRISQDERNGGERTDKFVYLSINWSSVPGNGWTTKCIEDISVSLFPWSHQISKGLLQHLLLLLHNLSIRTNEHNLKFSSNHHTSRGCCSCVIVFVLLKYMWVSTWRKKKENNQHGFFVYNVGTIMYSVLVSLVFGSFIFYIRFRVHAVIKYSSESLKYKEIQFGKKDE